MPTINRLRSLKPDDKKLHHVGSPPTSFVNPWPSFSDREGGPLSILKTRFGTGRPEFVPVPDRAELVQVRKPSFDVPSSAFKVTWIGHASFLVRTGAGPDAPRGMNILCDPVFSERTSPFSFIGPKRYTPTPFTLEELVAAVEVDLVLISHNHYDHADITTLKHLYENRQAKIQFLVGLNNGRWLQAAGIPKSQITEVDWWDQTECNIEGVGSLRITCTPSQHFSSRGIRDRNQDLWCSYVIEESRAAVASNRSKKIFFAGDTGYRSVAEAGLSREDEDKLPACPAFKTIGELLGPFELALLPIGLCHPRTFMSNVHANPWDSIQVHQDIRSMKSIGMHWGTVRGGLSAAYEDVRTPPLQWKEAAEEAGLEWGKEIALMDIGETILLD